MQWVKCSAVILLLLLFIEWLRCCIAWQLLLVVSQAVVLMQWV
jgi:hypothetical protein